MVLAFINAGANVDVRMRGGDTALHVAAKRGNGEVIVALLDAGADPALGSTDGAGVLVPIDFAVGVGSAGMVCDLLRAGGGIKGCGGESEGMNAFRYAIDQSHLGIATALSGAGVTDEGSALMIAVNNADEDCARFLLRRWQERRHAMPPRYLDVVISHETGGLLGVSTKGGSVTPLTLAIKQSNKYASLKIAKSLIEVGADVTKVVTITDPSTGTPNTTMAPVDLVDHLLRESLCDSGRDRERLKAMGRLLHQVDAVRGASWLWPVGVVGTAATAAETMATTRTMLQGMKRRAGRRRLPLVLVLHEARAGFES